MANLLINRLDVFSFFTKNPILNSLHKGRLFGCQPGIASGFDVVLRKQSQGKGLNRR